MRTLITLLLISAPATAERTRLGTAADAATPTRVVRGSLKVEVSDSSQASAHKVPRLNAT